MKSKVKNSEELMDVLVEFAEHNHAVIDNQMSDVPYTNLVFKLQDKTMIVSVVEDTEDCYK